MLPLNCLTSWWDRNLYMHGGCDTVATGVFMKRAGTAKNNGKAGIMKKKKKVTL